jgi:hypothetical protein
LSTIKNIWLTKAEVKLLFSRVSFGKIKNYKGDCYMFLKRIETERLSHYSYIVGDGSDLAVIDPMRDIGIYMKEARKAGMRIKHIFEIHRNEDYVIGSMELAKKTGVKIYISAHEELGHVYGEKIKDGFEVKLGSITLKALHTPGSIYMSKSNISTFIGAIFSSDSKVVFAIDGDYGEVEDLYWYCRRIGFDNIVGYLPNACKNGRKVDLNWKNFPRLQQLILKN